MQSTYFLGSKNYSTKGKVSQGTCVSKMCGQGKWPITFKDRWANYVKHNYHVN